MRTLILFFILLVNISLLFAQNNAPEVTNVTFTQRSDGSFIVDVYYDLNDADGDTMSVLMMVSNDAGDNWNFSCDSITGDFGLNILSGNGKHIEWDFGAGHPETYGDQYRVKIIADDSNFEKGTVTDIDGNIYITVKIGNQWWMAENLKVIHYRNGDSIPNITSDSEWKDLSTGAYCNYNNDSVNVATYGRLYNWFAVNTGNLCPTGWHVPKDAEWQILVDFLGGSSVAGGKMKTTGTIEGGGGLWYSPNTGATNSSGFSALPAGSCGHFGDFTRMDSIAIFWSASASDTYNAWNRGLVFDYSGVYRYSGGSSKNCGRSIRCVRD